MERNATWYGIGTEASKNDYRDLLKSADLDYNVVAEDLWVTHNGTDIQVPGKKVILREDTSDIFGVVSDRYKLCSNREAFDFVENIDDVKLIKAGSAGGMVWMIGELPEVEVLGDTIKPNLIFQNSHDGSCSIKTTICMLRMVCQNQFVGSFQNSPATISIQHSGDLEGKLLAARQTMQGVYQYVKSYDEVANELVGEKISSKKFDQIVEGFFKIPDEATTRTENFILERRELFRAAYQADDNQNFVGTKWGVINAYSDFITHEEFARKTNNWQMNRFMYSLNPSTMNNFMEIVEAA